MKKKKSAIEKVVEPQKPISRRERRRAETREKIFRTALQLFAERGFNATTIDAIAAGADIGKGTFFNYFENKESIIIQFSEIQVGRIKAFIGEHMDSDEPLSSLIYRFALIMTEEQQKNPSLFQSLMAAVFSNAVMRKRFSSGLIRIREFLTDLMEKRQKAGEIRTDISACEIAYSLQRVLFGSMLLWSVSPTRTLEEHLRDVLSVFVSGIKNEI